MLNISAPFQNSPIFQSLMSCDKPVIIQQGGTNSGKTYTILLYLVTELVKNPRWTCLVVGQSIPNLKKGSIKDLTNIFYDIQKKVDPRVAHLFKTRYNSTDKKHYFTNGSTLEFTSYETEQDAKSGKRELLFINEANGVKWGVYDQLADRTTEKVIIDFNADAPFWAHKKLPPNDLNAWFFSNYTHNPALNENSRRKIEAKKHNKQWWQVYGLGKTGAAENIIFDNIVWLKESFVFPKGCKQISYGLDFGYTDPTTFVKTAYYDGAIYGKLLFYETGLTNPEIAKKIKSFGVKITDQIFADSAEPKSIDEINNTGGLKLQPAPKGPDSIRAGINLLKERPLKLVFCEEWKEEQLQYKWHPTKRDRNNRPKPTEGYDHIFDALRYARFGLKHRPKNKLLGFGRAG